MNTETTIKPQPKLILPFLAWNFGWTWGFWLLDIILKKTLARQSTYSLSCS